MGALAGSQGLPLGSDLHRTCGCAVRTPHSHPTAGPVPPPREAHLTHHALLLHLAGQAGALPEEHTHIMSTASIALDQL